MSWITKWSFKNKAAVTLVSMIILIMGVLSYMRLPMEFLPSADQPFISVVAVGQGMDSSAMEEQVTIPIEKSVSNVNGKKEVFSTTGDGYSKIDIHFESKTDKKEAKREIDEALNSLSLPPNVMKPNVVQLNTSMIPVSYVAISFEEGVTPANIQFANDELVPYFKEIKGVSDIQTFGTVASYVSVQIDEEKLTEKQLSIQQVMSVLQGQNLAASVGEKTIDGKSSNIQVVGDVNSLESLKDISVVPSVTLDDVSEITVKKPENNYTRVNGQDGLLFVVTKDSQSNVVTINEEVEKASEVINKEYKDVETNIFLSSAEMVESSVQSMIKEVLLGALFATIVIMLFLRNIRSTFITIVSIPLSLGFTLFLLAQSGVTLNILTLGGVAVAVGRLVDDSIVVIENIFRKTETEKLSVKLVVEATKEVGTAITSSTLTTVAVFLPMGLLEGGLQEFLLPFALTITYSLLASLLVALTVVPLMSAGLLKNTKLKEPKPSRKYQGFLTWSLNHKWVVLLTAFLLFAGSIAAYVVLPKGSVQKPKSDYVYASLSYPNNTPIEKVKKESLELEKFMMMQENVDSTYLQLGNTEDSMKYGDVSSPTETTLMVTLAEGAKEEDFIAKVETQKKEYSDATLEVSEQSLMGGQQTAITIDVLGDDLEQIEKVASDVKTEIVGIKGIEKVSTNHEEKKTVYSLVVDPSKANAEQVAQQTAVMLNSTPIGSIKVEEQQTSVVIEPLMSPETEKEINEVLIQTEAGIVPISSVANLEMEEKATNIFHKEGVQYARVTAIVDPAKLSEISTKINANVLGDKETEGIDVPEGVQVLVGGASVDQEDEFTDLFMTMLASIGIVFLIMIITFKTVRAPIAILFSLPLAAIGAILGLLISGISVDITALLGALMLIGIVVTNAIVLLDRVRQNEQTMIIRDAIVEAATTRMRPILMTAIATICAMLPLLFKEAETGNLVSASLAIVVIGGLSVATLLTLVVIPVVYELLHFKKAKKQRAEVENNTQEISESI
ncbi:efflux RND transporter permease subunit [Metabacillus herbersteinensis]|uniref:Efflux RND transporter permease subunit n=1 Tax=Metabacillus herbersteinensis TaxID=283816 RepID=A0ABV6GAZ0_9BACI